ncbi:MAG TPA: hypothetical protein DCL96_09335 [Prevotella sp.]|jgi:DNA-binding transcriptional regulator GbsR (MarR family)|nr:hypothetical protein [Prevotella sp.]
MLFKELKSNYPIFLLDRATLKFEQAKVMNVQPNYQSVNMNRIEVNVTIQNKEGKQNTYAVADSEQSAYAGNLFISTSKDCIINEVNALKNASEEVLSKVEEHKQTVEKCKELLGELDTTFRDQQKTNERLDQMENKLDEIFKFVKSQKQE